MSCLDTNELIYRKPRLERRAGLEDDIRAESGRDFHPAVRQLDSLVCCASDAIPSAAPPQPKVHDATRGEGGAAL